MSDELSLKKQHELGLKIQEVETALHGLKLSISPNKDSISTGMKMKSLKVVSVMEKDGRDEQVELHFDPNEETQIFMNLSSVRQVEETSEGFKPGPETTTHILIKRLRK